MTINAVEIRSGAYYDSVILMQLQQSLASQPGVIDAGVVMGTEANKDVLAQSELLATEAESAGPDDMVIVVRAEDEAAAQAALEQVDELLTKLRDSKYVGFLALEPHLVVAGHSGGFSNVSGMGYAVTTLRRLMAELGCVEADTAVG